ncbi:hypothetical protein SK3146_05314 [Paenibacillus konkukensis]|uniref:Uncharacterized protein n=1 Tax=Paenibacillus konkukensis TaxID=2020716 RepID=A0ABY4RU47_9BACL|nr:hypothetical protein SK3146_05314 [Paenibacillus konkukensis]
MGSLGCFGKIALTVFGQGGSRPWTPCKDEAASRARLRVEQNGWVRWAVSGKSRSRFWTGRQSPLDPQQGRSGFESTLEGGAKRMGSLGCFDRKSRSRFWTGRQSPLDPRQGRSGFESTLEGGAKRMGSLGCFGKIALTVFGQGGSRPWTLARTKRLREHA